MKIAILIGSIRQGRQSQKIAHYLQDRLQADDLDIDLIDLAETPLPMLEERVGKHPQLPQVVQELSNRLHSADAVIMVTPEYHGSFSGVLKNALDYFYSEFSRKVIGIVTVSAGKFGGINAATQLQQVILSLGAFALPTKLLVPEVYGAFNATHELTNEHTLRSAQKFIDDFRWFASAIQEKKQQTTVNI
ncbi:NADPH-dependent FMN reductase [Chitinophaga sp. 22321]|uniref:NAD(P)H-dependent oxidoreductase n=1 Tax=Chitinophaga hostae TaxID=2831022 RepID=A0ABS5JC42_9BACT|nr:NADPH-dependent FMN reductase [Chitinophaga hostae]MBS0032177.1 NAD(P)H-dependent oxidoreductase [Chitinophaga hostae]